MTYWFKVLCWVCAFLLGRGLNVWQTSTHGGVMPLTFPFGDWIPCMGYLASVGDFLQLLGLVAIILATLQRLCDERYVRKA
jgi:hypothetical protein